MKWFLSVLLLFSLLNWSSNAQQELENPPKIEKFLVTAKEKGIISEEQYGQLMVLSMDKFQGEARESVNTQAGSSSQSVFVKMYNHLTLLNVLYFSGSLLIMGAYSLFMTLAFEHFTQRRWADMIALQAAGFGSVGLLIWNTDYQFLGGL